MDSSSIHLFRATCVGHGEKIEIHLTRAGSKSEITYLTYELEHCLFTNYSFTASESRATETLTLNGNKIRMAYHPQDAGAAGGHAVREDYDLKTHK
jgi:type VI protein secretion system component Hcp